jgi:hypothetical protein
MIAATLFSGIGAPETAMPEWQWIWHAEIERFPNAGAAFFLCPGGHNGRFVKGWKTKKSCSPDGQNGLYYGAWKTGRK